MDLINTAKTTVNVQIHNTKGELLWEGHNTTVMSGLNLLALMLAQQAGITTYSGLNYCSIGTSATPIVSPQTQLVAETYRLPFTSLITVTNNQLAVQTFFPAAHCTVNIQELGLFAMATGTANSGTMYARVLAAYDNSVLAQDLIVTWSVAFNSLD